MNKRLDGKVAIITGSTSGIGRATAELFAEQGARVTVHGRRRELGEQVVSLIGESGGEALYIAGDVAQPGDLRGLVAKTVEYFGRLDILMNNAYSGRNGRVTDLCPEDWDETFATTVKAAALASKYAIPEIIKSGGGAIIHVSSVHGLLGGAQGLPYDAMKAALINLTRQMAVDYGRDGIRVNAICPGRIVTEKKIEFLEQHPEQVILQEIVYPLGRPGTMREAAQVALFLASDEASFVTGQAVVVDGGLTAQLQDSVGAAVEQALR